MIDLVKYEKEIRGHKANGIPLRPVPPIPGRIGREYTEKELQTEHDNQRLAKLIYEAVENGK